MQENGLSARLDYDTALEGVFRSPGPCHYCSVSNREEEQLYTAVPFLVAGLVNGERCVYICDQTPKDDVTKAVLSHSRVSPSEVEKNLSVMSKDEFYIDHGRFDMNRVLKTISDLERRSVAAGYSGLRGVGEMSWATQDVEGSDDLIEYEARVNSLFPNMNARLLCQYEEHEFDSRILLDALRVHPRVVIRGTVCWNPYYIPPNEFIAQMSGEISPALYERVWRDILRRTRFAEIHTMELKELRKANRKVDLFNQVLFGEIQSQLSVMSFFSELAMDACKEPGTLDYIQEVVKKCGEVQKHLDFMKAYQMIGISESKWQSLAEIIDLAARSVGVEDVHMSSRLESVEILADDLLEGAFHAVLENLRRACPEDLRVEVSSLRSLEGVVVGFECQGRESVLEGNASATEYHETGFDEPDMLLAKEFFQASGMKTREVGAPGRLARFEVTIPPSRFRLTE